MLASPAGGDRGIWPSSATNPKIMQPYERYEICRLSRIEDEHDFPPYDSMHYPLSFASA